MTKTIQNKSWKKQNKNSKRDKIKIEEQLKRNIRIYYAYRFFCRMEFVMPVFMLFLIDRGLNNFQIFFIQAVYTITELILTVPLGVFADRAGRKKTLILSTVLYAAGFVIYSFADNFTEILLVELVFALSSAAFSGTGEALLYDSLTEMKEQKKYKKVIGTAYAIESIVGGGSAVIGGIIAKYSLSLPFLITAIPVTISLVPLFLLKEPMRIKKCRKSYWSMMKQTAVFVSKKRHLRNILYYVAVTTLVGFTGFLLYQPLFTNKGLGVEYLGVVMLLFSASCALGSKLAHKVEFGLRRTRLMLVLATVKALLYFLVYLAGGVYLIIFVMLFSIITGISSTLVSDWMNKQARAKNRATLLSFSSMSGNLAYALFSPAVGLFVDAYNEQTAYLLLAVILIGYVLRGVIMLLVRDC
jgi:MFS family permease